MDGLWKVIRNLNQVGQFLSHDLNLCPPENIEKVITALVIIIILKVALWWSETKSLGNWSASRSIIPAQMH